MYLACAVNNSQRTKVLGRYAATGCFVSAEAAAGP
jgi:hypothetical protein